MNITPKNEREEVIRACIFDERFSIPELIELLEEYIPIYGKIQTESMKTREDLFHAVAALIDEHVPNIVKHMEKLKGRQ